VTPLLDVRGLTTILDIGGATATVVDDVSFSIDRARTVALVGESGCGKSMTALSLLRIVPAPPARIVAGEVRLDGRDLLSLPEREMRRVRGSDIAMIFQDPMTSLNPVLAIGDQITEGMLEHRDLSRGEARREAIELLRRVHIPDPGRRIDEYPHRLSGGMRQRAMIAMALACRPRLLIADEPTTALDVTIQAQILELMKELQAELGTGLLLITHNLGIVGDMAERVLVMYAGRIVENVATADLFDRPLHPYTRGLLAATPRIVRDRAPGPRGRLAEIPGMVPRVHEVTAGCAFAPRCPRVEPRCRTQRPTLDLVPGDRAVACLVVQAEHAA
jgi:peptide/nickel transport system ATP-binding protein